MTASPLPFGPLPTGADRATPARTGGTARRAAGTER
jgi:hypothetical protein